MSAHLKNHGQASPSPCRLLITAGPTWEPIDAVRYLGNRSSGRLGLALAAASTARNWPTTLLLGPGCRPPADHSLLQVVRFQTAGDLQRLLATHWPRHDVLFMAAAVADYQVDHGSAQGKIRRDPAGLTLNLKPTPDLLTDLASITRPDQVTVGWALEPDENLLASARGKLARKRLHAIVANPLATMDSATVTATLLFRDGTVLQAPPGISKAEFADWLLDRLPGNPEKSGGAAREMPTGDV